MDLPGEKLLIKLWETLAEKGIGSLLEPWQTKRQGRAHAEVRRNEMLMLAQAELDVADLRAGRKQLLNDGALMLTGPAEVGPYAEHRIEPTVALSHAVISGTRTAAADLARSEINVSKAVVFAEEQLACDQQEPPTRAVDDDWLSAWREHAGRVSAEDLQRLWGSVLAGEVKSPGRYSIRTLDFLKTLSKAEAEQISKLASYVIEGRIARSQKEYLQSKGLDFSFLFGMQELGVVSGVEAIGLTTKFRSAVPNAFLRPLFSHRKVLVVEHVDANKTLELEVYKLTEIGSQVLALGSFEPDVGYLEDVGRQIAGKGFRVQLADWRQVSETHGEYFNAQELRTGEDANAA